MTTRSGLFRTAPFQSGLHARRAARVSMAITTIIMGATMVAMKDAIRATEGATLMTRMNNGLRTTMDLVVRDLLQVGQGLPSGHVVMVRRRRGAGSAAGRSGTN